MNGKSKNIWHNIHVICSVQQQSVDPQQYSQCTAVANNNNTSNNNNNNTEQVTNA